MPNSRLQKNQQKTLRNPKRIFLAKIKLKKKRTFFEKHSATTTKISAVNEEEPEIAQTSGLEIPQEPQKQNNNINIKKLRQATTIYLNSFSIFFKKEAAYNDKNNCNNNKILQIKISDQKATKKKL